MTRAEAEKLAAEFAKPAHSYNMEYYARVGEPGQWGVWSRNRMKIGDPGRWQVMPS